ncbi:MAG TPA: NAD(P)/FAD-dependent oxidoreductase [Mycobacteriales bacterium]|nr:NAD(P)/FAD-dependent oxidoreductase [Mycobacteriales bacterium]
MSSAANSYDAIVVGGGHNGLVAAAYLAKAGQRVVVCEARHVVGGAAVTEQPFGPDFHVTSLSYVVSLLPPRLVSDLRLREHGYHVFPQGPYFVPREDGRFFQLPDDRALRYRTVAEWSSSREAEALQRYDAWLDDLASVLSPLLDEIPPKLGSRRPADVLDQLRLVRRLRAIDTRRAVEVTRLFTLSIADLVEDYFSDDQMKGVLSVSGVIGTWAGPRSAGTAYVMAHHHVGDIGGGQVGAWGFARGGMGGVTQAIAASARSFGVEIRTSTPVTRITSSGGAVTGVVLEGGDELSAPVVVTTAHPAISFLRLVDRSALPEDFVADIERWKSRSGTVKVNLALDRLPTFRSHPEFDPQVHGGTIVLAESLDEVEGAFQDAVAGRASARPFADICIPSVFDDSLAPPGKHVMSMFTQWVPHEWSHEPHVEDINAHADRVIARMEAVAPGFTDSIVGRQVIGPWQMEHEYGLVGGNIFHGELSSSQLFHTRPAAGYADLRTPIRGLYQAGSATHGGGGVTGIPGHNVVTQILRDRRRASRSLSRARVRTARG